MADGPVGRGRGHARRREGGSAETVGERHHFGEWRFILVRGYTVVPPRSFPRGKIRRLK